MSELELNQHMVDLENFREDLIRRKASARFDNKQVLYHKLAGWIPEVLSEIKFTYECLQNLELDDNSESETD